MKMTEYIWSLIMWNKPAVRENEVICTASSNHWAALSLRFAESPVHESAGMTAFCWLRKIWKVLFARHCQHVRFDLALGPWEDSLKIHLRGQLSRLCNTMLHHGVCSRTTGPTSQTSHAGNTTNAGETLLMPDGKMMEKGYMEEKGNTRKKRYFHFLIWWQMSRIFYLLLSVIFSSPSQDSNECVWKAFIPDGL